MAIAMAAPMSAFAADGVEATLFGDQALGPATRACFTRRYDDAHLAAHPKQNVREMMVLIGTEPIEGEKTRRLAFQLSTRFHNRSGRLESGGSCGGKGASAECAVDCDGGGVSITPSADGRTVMLKAMRLRVWKAGSSPEDTAQDLDVGGDDHAFRLERAALDQCTPLLPKDERLKRLKRK